MGAGVGALPHRTRPAASGNPLGAVVLFHGRGTNEHDLFPLLDVLDPDARLVGLTPRGPFAFTEGGAHWYAVRRVGYPDRDTFDAGFSRAVEWVDALPAALGVPLERTVLGGFSQGAVMSYALALATGRPTPAGVMALSGFIPTVEGLSLDLEGRDGLPVAIEHGVHDPVIGVEWGRRARDRLTAARAAVSYHEAPIAHGVDPASLPRLAAWLDQTIEPAG